MPQRSFARMINTAQRYSREDGLTPRSCRTLETLTEESGEGQGYSQVDFLANLTVLAGSEEARRMTVRSGEKCSVLLTRQGRVGWLLKMLLESSVWDSPILFLTWKVRATKSGHALYQLAPCTRGTEETEFGLLPTPTAHDAIDGNYPSEKKRNHGAGTLTSQAGGKLNPEWIEWLMGYPIGHTDLKH